MLRSVVVEFGSAGASFLIALQRDLYRFGREDVLIFTVGDRTVFTWNSKVTAPASRILARGFPGQPAVRQASYSRRN